MRRAVRPGEGAAERVWGSCVKFRLIDEIIEQADDRIVAVKNVTLAEEYLRDHFPSFPVLPGVLMVETLVQAARELVAGQTGGARLVLGEAKAIRYGRFVKPGESLRVEVELLGRGEGEHGVWRFKGVGAVVHTADLAIAPRSSLETAVAGRFSLRPIRRVGHAPIWASRPELAPVGAAAVDDAAVMPED